MLSIFSWSWWSGEPEAPKARVAVQAAHQAVALNTAQHRAGQQNPPTSGVVALSTQRAVREGPVAQ
ncbi:MAG TPA: hypothetical protein VGL88_11770 [Pseudonocardiaceae bacterium]|jgi:hypothetical protein